MQNLIRSIQSALLMAAEGADGETLREIKEALHISDFDKPAMRKVYKDLAASLISEPESAKLRLANAFFYDEGRVYTKENFMSTIRDHYNAEIINRDFSPPDAPGAVNAWVAEQTEGKIKEVIDDIKPEQVAFLLNALYFRSDWADGFAEEATRFSAFTCSDGTVAEAAMMQRDGNLLTAEVDGFVAVNLAFADSVFSLTAIRPKDFIPDDTASLKKINSNLLEKLDAAMGQGRVMLRLPKTELKFGESLIPNLKSMGVKNAFSKPSADFSSLGTAAVGNLYIDLLRHDAVLVIDERGAEGAAVTTVGIGATSMPPEISFDVPYTIVLRHAETGVVLFLGQVNQLGNPVVAE
ncbi:MAG: hypothetical protein LC670_10275 [Flavobacteriales bacterium]|nr:hypothetical protein [Flavobacteriales bacterium]